MRKSIAGVCALIFLSVSACAGHATPVVSAPLPAPTPAVSRDWSDMPLWAYGVTAVPLAGDQAKPQGPPGRSFDPAIDHDEQLKPLHVEGSSRTYTLVDLSDWQNEVDWFPNEHKPMPAVVEQGPASLGAQTRACAVCHKTNGGGRPENAAIAGLSVAYFVRQLGDFRAGRRASSDPRKPNVPTMVALARAMSDGEEHAAAEYYAAQSGGPQLQVIETDRVPPAHLDGNLYVASGSERTEPLHERILEVAQDSRQSETLDNPHFGYIAYVPTGSRLTAAQMTDIAAYVAALPRVPAAVTSAGAAAALDSESAAATSGTQTPP